MYCKIYARCFMWSEYFNFQKENYNPLFVFTVANSLYFQVNPTDGLFSLASSDESVLTAEKVINRVEDTYTSWSSWTPCSKSCTQQRFRRCKKTENCTEKILTAERTCFRARGRCSARRLPKKQTNTKSIIEDIVYDLIYYDWSEWSACTRACKKRRYRTCALKRWCKHTVLLEEKECYSPGTNCERRYMFTDPDDYDKYADHNHDENGIYNSMSSCGLCYSNRNVLNGNKGLFILSERESEILFSFCLCLMRIAN